MAFSLSPYFEISPRPAQSHQPRQTLSGRKSQQLGGNLSTSRWRDFEPSPPRVAFRLGDNFKLARNNLSKACALCSEAYRWMSSSWFDNYTLNHLNPLDPYLISTLTPRRQPERSLKYVGLQQQNQRVSRRNLGEV
jgi:hypothetical protein